MLLLASGSDTLAVVTTGEIGSGVDVHASYVDTNGNVMAFGRTNTPRITSATTTVVVASPSHSSQRAVKFLSASNVNLVASAQITMQLFDGTTTSTLFKYILLAGETLQYREDTGWTVIDSLGHIKTTS